MGILSDLINNQFIEKKLINVLVIMIDILLKVECRMCGRLVLFLKAYKCTLKSITIDHFMYYIFLLNGPSKCFAQIYKSTTIETILENIKMCHHSIEN